jgi:hypothetical protein
VITGDLVDNWGDQSRERYGHQFEGDYQLYRELWEPYRSQFQTVIDQPGNHDVFGLFDFSSPSHFYMNYSTYFSGRNVTRVEDFWVSIHETPNCTFVSLNPFRFPTPHARFDFFARPSRGLLDAIEVALLGLSGRKPIVLLCHYPIDFWIHKWVRSLHGRTFRELIGAFNASIFLSGHTHPPRGQWFHHKGLIEAVGRDLVEHDGWAIVTIDNGRAVHHSFGLSDDPIAILTHPPPAKGLSNAMPFVEATTAVRVVSKSGTLNVSVGGQVMRRVRHLGNGLWLYAVPLEGVAPGFHKLEFRGDWTYESEFFVGEELPSFKEPVYASDPSLISAQFAFYFVSFVNLLLLLPVGCCRVGPRGRIAMLPFWLRIVLFGAFLAPVGLPISFLDIEGHVGINFWYGYYVGGTLFYDVWGQIIVMVYQAGVVLGVALFASAIAVSSPWHPVFLVDGIVAALTWACALNFVRVAVAEAAGIVYTMLSPLFMFVPAFVYVVIIVWRLTTGPSFFRGARGRKAQKKVD